MRKGLLPERLIVETYSLLLALTPWIVQRCSVFLEIGPHPGLVGLGLHCPNSEQMRWVPSIDDNMSELEGIAHAAALMVVETHPRNPLALPGALPADATAARALLGDALVAEFDALCCQAISPNAVVAAPSKALPSSDAKSTAALLPELTALARDVMHLDESAELDPTRPLSEVGLTSMLGLRLKDRIARHFHLGALPATLLFEYPNLAALAGFVADQLATSHSTPGPAATAPSTPAPTLSSAALESGLFHVRSCSIRVWTCSLAHSPRRLIAGFFVNTPPCACSDGAADGDLARSPAPGRWTCHRPGTAP